MRIVARSGTWLALVLLCLRQLHDIDIASPPDGATGPDAAAALVMSLARLVAIGLGWYLVAATVLTLVVGLVGAASPITAKVVPRTVDDLLSRVCGLAIVLTAGLPTIAAATDERPPITMARLADERGADDRSAITMRRLEAPPPIDAPAPPEAAPSAVRPGPTRHVIAPGEHLWAVAESTLRAAWQAAPTDAEIDPYWRELVDRNRARLPDPSNPDLVHPDFDVEVPPVPARQV